MAGVLFAQPGGMLAPSDKAILVIRVPADATLSIGDQTFEQKGGERRLITPSLKLSRCRSNSSICSLSR